MDAHRVSHDRPGVDGYNRRFMPRFFARSADDGYSTPIHHSLPTQTLNEFRERFSSAGRGRLAPRLFGSLAQPAERASAKTDTKQSRREEEKRKRKEKWVDKSVDYIIGLILSISASVITWRIIQWLRGRRGDNGDDDDASDSTGPAKRSKPLTSREAYKQTAKEASFDDSITMDVPRTTSGIAEATFVRMRSDNILRPQVLRALCDGYSDLAWGMLMARIVDKRFNGNYEQRNRSAERFLRGSFDLSLDDLLGRAPARSWYFMSNRFRTDGRMANWLRSARAFFGLHEKPQPLTAFDVVRIMSSEKPGSFGLTSSDAMQVALLWVLKETRLSFKERPAHEASDDFIALAAAFSGNPSVRGPDATPFTLLVSRINYQLRNGCRFVHDHATISHLAHYLNERCNDRTIAGALGTILESGGCLKTAMAIDRHVITDILDEAEQPEIDYAISLQKLVAARLKYLAVIAGNYPANSDPHKILESARANIIEAIQRAVATGLPLKSYRDYIKTTAKDIGLALDAFKGPGEGFGGSENASPHEGEPASQPHYTNVAASMQGFVGAAAPSFMPADRMTPSAISMVHRHMAAPMMPRFLPR